MRDALIRKIKLCLRGWQLNKYQRTSDFTDAVLRVVYGASLYELRIELLTYALTNAGFETDDSDFDPPLGNGVDDEIFSRHIERFGESLNNLLSRCLRENVAPERFGRLVLDWLEALPNREAMVVALAVIFQCPLIPYVKIPDYLRGRGLAIKIDKADFEKMSVRESLALLRRTFGPMGLQDVPIEVFAVIIQKVLAGHKEDGEIQLILARALKWFISYVDTQRTESVKRVFGGALEEVFEMIKRRDVPKDEGETSKTPKGDQLKRTLN